jgi:hypothetical protein
MTDFHTNANPVTAPLNSATEQGVDNLIRQDGAAVAKAKIAGADAGLGDLALRITRKAKDEAKKPAKMLENRAASFIQPITIPTPTLPDIGSITQRVGGVFNSIQTSDTKKLNAALSAASTIRSSASMEKFKERKSGQVAAKSALKISELVALLATINSLRNMLQKKKV